MKKAKNFKGKSANKKSIFKKRNKPIKNKSKIGLKKPIISPKMTIFEIVSKFPKTAKVFYKYGLHCFGCSVAKYENISQAAKVHGISENNLLNDLKKTAK